MKTGCTIHVNMEYLRCFHLPFFVEKPGLLKHGVVDFCNVFCCVCRPVREKGVGELLL